MSQLYETENNINIPEDRIIIDLLDLLIPKRQRKSIKHDMCGY